METNVKKLEAELEKTLKEKPHLRAHQKEIDSMLSKCTSREDRMTALSIMMTAKVHEMAFEFQRLQAMLDGIKEGLEREIE